MEGFNKFDESFKGNLSFMTLKKLIIVIVGLAFFGMLYALYDIYMKGCLHSLTGLVFLTSFLILLFPFIYLVKKISLPFYSRIVRVYFGFVAVIIPAEIFLRLTAFVPINTEYYYFQYISFHKTLYHTLNANSTHFLKRIEYCFPRHTNSLGLSDKEPDAEKKNGDVVILGLGDSFTEGDGAHEDSTWLKFLERDMGYRPDVNYRFINAGVSGSDPFFCYMLLKDKLLRYNPDIVITTVGSDIEEIICRGGMERFKNNTRAVYPRLNWWEPFYAFSYTVRLLVHKGLGYNFLLMSQEDFEKEAQIAVNQLKECLLLYKDLSASGNFKLLVVFYPMKQEIINKKYQYWDELISFAEKENIACADLLAYYKDSLNMNENNMLDYYWVHDGHHNVRGYEAFAKGVYDKLKALGWI
ncbi:MAG: hypothetical protein BWY70_01523 [Bacteroidetes bacterium ADurb.Bin408]|nr:MAG: hypothetical protein BWY70_01523 [Bacteroidetes bacterium ADurb.Bin408]